MENAETQRKRRILDNILAGSGRQRVEKFLTGTLWPTYLTSVPPLKHIIITIPT